MNALLKEIKTGLNLSAQLSMLLELLLLKQEVTKDELYQAIVDYNPRIQHSKSTVRMAIYRLRHVLATKGFHIYSRYGEGYYMPPSDKALLKAMIRRDSEEEAIS